MRKLFTLCLCLILALSSGTMALARGQALAAGEIVLCRGQGPVAVPIDARGNPTGAPHLCADCLSELFTASIAAPAALPGKADWRIEPYPGAPQTDAAAVSARLAKARAPPGPL